MALADQSRYDLHRRLAGFLDEETATDLMAHLPPIEWRDVATKQDLGALRDWAALRFDDIDRRFEEVDRRFAEVDRRFVEIGHRFDEVDRRFDGLRDVFATKEDLAAALRHHTTIMVTALVAVLTVNVGALAWVAQLTG